MNTIFLNIFVVSDIVYGQYLSPWQHLDLWKVKARDRGNATCQMVMDNFGHLLNDAPRTCWLAEVRKCTW